MTEHEPVKTCEEAAKVRNVTVDSGAKALLIKDNGKKLTLEGVPYYLAVMSASKKFHEKAGVRWREPEEIRELMVDTMESSEYCGLSTLTELMFEINCAPSV